MYCYNASMSKVVKLLLISQIVLVLAIIICTALLPQFLFSTDQGGVSNYGVNTETVVPFTLGFIGCGVLICLGAFALPKDARHQSSFRAALLLVGGLCLLVAVTTYTYKINAFFDNLHVFSTQALFLAEVPLAMWFALELVKSTLSRYLLIAFFFGFLLAVLTLLGMIHLLFIAEILTTFSFGALMVLAARKLTT